MFPSWMTTAFSENMKNPMPFAEVMSFFKKIMKCLFVLVFGETYKMIMYHMVNGLISSLLIELHLFGYQVCGDKGINTLDAACRLHEI